MDKAKLDPDERAHKVIAALREKDVKTQAQVALQTVCILGSHKTQMAAIEAIVKALNAGNCPAIYLKGIPATDLTLSDYEKERTIVECSDVVLILDHHEGGTVSECTYIMDRPHLADKTIMLVPDSLPEADFFSLEKHYRYFPVKLKFNNDGLVNTAVMAAKQAMHRLAERAVSKNSQKGDKNGS